MAEHDYEPTRSRNSNTKMSSVEPAPELGASPDGPKPDGNPAADGAGCPVCNEPQLSMRLADLAGLVVRWEFEGQHDRVTLRLPNGSELPAPRGLLDFPANPTIGLIKVLAVTLVFGFLIVQDGFFANPSHIRGDWFLTTLFSVMFVVMVLLDIGIVSFYGKHKGTYAQTALQQWLNLRYCFKDAIVFRVTDGQYVPAAAVRKLLPNTSLYSAYLQWLADEWQAWQQVHADFLIGQDDADAYKQLQSDPLIRRIRLLGSYLSRRSGIVRAALTGMIEVNDTIQVRGEGDYVVAGITQCVTSVSGESSVKRTTW